VLESVDETVSSGADYHEVNSFELITNHLQKLLEYTPVNDVTREELAELGEIINFSHDTTIPRDDVTSWIRDTYLNARGLDLGTFNADVIAVAFSEQPRKWGDTTKVYMSRVIVIIHHFIGTALCAVCRHGSRERSLPILKELVV